MRRVAEPRDARYQGPVGKDGDTGPFTIVRAEERAVLPKELQPFFVFFSSLSSFGLSSGVIGRGLGLQCFYCVTEKARCSPEAE